jgi:hypothetical protein
MNTNVKSSRRRFRLNLLIPIALFVGVGTAIAIPQTGSLALFSSQASSAGNSVSSAKGGIAFVDGDGAVSTAAAFSVTNAQPEMEAKVSTFTVKNTGTITQAVTVSSANLIDLRKPSLDDVLVLEVSDAAGTVVFEGKVSGLDQATIGELSAGESKVLTFSLTWPSTLDDNSYQSNSFVFDVGVNAISLGR